MYARHSRLTLRNEQGVSLQSLDPPRVKEILFWRSENSDHIRHVGINRSMVHFLFVCFEYSLWYTQFVVSHCKITQFVDSHCKITQFVVSHCKTTQFVVSHCKMTQFVVSHCKITQFVVSHCKITQFVVSHCKITQFVVSYCKIILYLF